MIELNDRSPVAEEMAGAARRAKLAGSGADFHHERYRDGRGQRKTGKSRSLVEMESWLEIGDSVPGSGPD